MSFAGHKKVPSAARRRRGRCRPSREPPNRSHRARRTGQSACHQLRLQHSHDPRRVGVSRGARPEIGSQSV